jgi:hypothetical protein
MDVMADRRTEVGNPRCLNSLTHGLTADTPIVLREKDRDKYEEKLHGFRESLQPHEAIEEALVPSSGTDALAETPLAPRRNTHASSARWTR